MRGGGIAEVDEESCYFLSHLKNVSLAMVVHTCNPSYTKIEVRE
jgi:hypothetical protein